MYGLSSFFIGEQKVADELGPIMRAAPTEAQRIFLSTQIADKVIDPPWDEEDDLELFGVSREETHAFAAQCLTRRLKVIGLAPAAA
jgi:hypothetical protein